MCIAEAADKLEYKVNDYPPAPAFDLFESKPDYYLKLWQDWWIANRDTMINKVNKFTQKPDFDSK